MALLKISQTSKLNGIRTFNLPAIYSCPHRTKNCEEYCYATRGRMGISTNQKLYMKNMALTKSPDFIWMMKVHLTENENFFRIHACGDFYSTSYFADWCKIAQQHPHITFLAYTRNWDIDGTQAPSNLKLIYSVDLSTKQLNPTIPRIAMIGPHRFYKDPMIKHGSTTFINGKSYIICKSNNCEKCLICWKTDKHIMFPQKYKTFEVNEL